MKQMSASASKKKRKVLEEQGLSAKDIAAKQAQEKKSKTLRNVLIVALAVVVCLAALFAVIALVNQPSYDTDAALITVGDEKITVPVYNYLYSLSASNFYNSYSYFIQTGVAVSQQNSIFGGDQTMEEYLIEGTNESLKEILNVYAKAKAEGFQLSDEEKASIAASLTSIQTEATTYGWPSVDKYLTARYGEGCDLESYERYVTLLTTYTAYANKLNDEFQPTDAELKAEYEKDTSAYDLVTFTYASVSTESTKVESDDTTDSTAASATVYSDEAKAAAKEKAEGYRTEMPEDARELTYSKSNITTYLNEEIADWLFDSARAEGDTAVFAKDENETGFYTVLYTARDTNDYCRVNAQFLTITKDAEKTEEESETGKDLSEVEGDEKKDTEANKQTAEEKLQALLEAVKSGMSDEDFNTAVTALGYTANESTISRTYSIQEIRDFLFDSSRQDGDLLTTYENENAYYVVRYVSTEEDTYRDLLVRGTLWNAYYEEIANAKEMTVDEDLLAHASTDLTFTSNTSAS